MGPHQVGREGHIHGADGFVRVLGAFLGLVNPGAFGQIFFAVGSGYVFLGGLAGLVGNAGGVRTHIGDKGRKPLVAQLHALIKTLRQIHGPLGRIAQALVGGLLQGRSDERRLGGALALLFHHKGLSREGGLQLFGLGRIGHYCFFVVDFCQIRLERRRRLSGQQGAEEPVFLRLKGLAGFLALHNKPQGHGLHPPGGNAAFDGLPEQGRNLVAYQSVQHATGLLGLKQVGIERPGAGQGLLDGPGGDFIELDALDVLGFILDQLGHVPGNGLPFAVGVRGQEHGFGLGGGAAQFADHLFFGVNHFIVRGKVVLLIHGQLARGQVAHMAYAGLHHVLRPQKLFDGLHLGRRFHNNQLFAHAAPVLRGGAVMPRRRYGKIRQNRIASSTPRRSRSGQGTGYALCRYNLP